MSTKKGELEAEVNAKREGSKGAAYIPTIWCVNEETIYASGRNHGWKQGLDTNVNNSTKMAGHSQRKHPQQENLGRGK